MDFENCIYEEIMIKLTTYARIAPSGEEDNYFEEDTHIEF